MRHTLQRRNSDRHAHTSHLPTPRAPHPPLRVIPVALLTGVLLLFGVAVAQSPPPNDDIANATVFTTLPFTDGPLDTTVATTALDDPDCAGNGPTVWYVFIPAAGGFVMVNTFGSDYDTTLSVYTGEPGALTQITCNDDFNSLQSLVSFEAIADTPYYIMVGSFASGPGGSLIFNADVTPPPLVFDLALSGKGSVNAKTGVATIRGTVTCSGPGYVYDLYGTLQQKKGRVLFRADFFAGGFECTPPETAWSATAASPNGLFTGGKTILSNVFSYACNELYCDDVYIPGPVTVQLTGKNKK
jgi:hypothetical protein